LWWVRVKIKQLFWLNKSITYSAQVFNPLKAAKSGVFLPQAAKKVSSW
jgi:hypothetical protein